jgi:molybdopterin-guanine dinucleotide biosynthesis protein A
MPNVAGLILCGGQSSRMGQPKAWLNFAGEPLLARMVRTVGSVANRVLVVAAPGQPLPDLPPDVEIVRDEWEGCGPLAGLCAGFRRLQGEAELVFVAACDVPLLRPELIRRVLDLLQDSPAAEATIPRVLGRVHPLVAAYRIGVLPLWQRQLEARQLRLLTAIEFLRVRWVEDADLAEVDPHFDSLQNANTPAEFESLRILAENQPPSA